MSHTCLVYGSMVLEEMAVHIPQQKWTLLNPDLNNLRRDLILENPRSLAPTDYETQLKTLESVAQQYIHGEKIPKQESRKNHKECFLALHLRETWHAMALKFFTKTSRGIWEVTWWILLNESKKDNLCKATFLQISNLQCWKKVPLGCHPMSIVQNALRDLHPRES